MLACSEGMLAVTLVPNQFSNMGKNQKLLDIFHEKKKKKKKSVFVSSIGEQIFKSWEVQNQISITLKTFM